MTAILTVQHVDKAFGSRRVLTDVSFAVGEQDRIGIVGLNGAGKSTLLRLLVGGDTADAGLITRRRELTLEYVAQEPLLDGASTVGETVREGLRAHQAALAQLGTIEATIAALGAAMSGGTAMSELTTRQSGIPGDDNPGALDAPELTTRQSGIPGEADRGATEEPELTTRQSGIPDSQDSRSTGKQQLTTRQSGIPGEDNPGALDEQELTTRQSGIPGNDNPGALDEPELTTRQSGILAEDNPAPLGGPELTTRQSGILAEDNPGSMEKPQLTTRQSGIPGARDSRASRSPSEPQTTARDEARLRAALEAQAELHARIEASGGWEREHEIRTLASALQLPPLDAKIATLSGGERRRVALARALLARPALLALDEPTNHLDPETVLWLETRLSDWQGALLLVTHDRYFLDRVATRILEIDRGRLYSYEGGYTRFVEQQAERLTEESGREDARRSFVRRELDWIRRGPKARSTKQKARIDRFDAAVSSAPSQDDKRPGPLTLRLPTGGRIGKTILELRDVGKSLGGKQLFNHLTLTMKPGDRIGVVGPNGAGKTTLVRTILGLIPPDSGEVVVGQNTRFSYLSQTRDSLRDDKTVLEEVSDGNDHVYLDDGPVHVRTFLRMLLFDDRFAETPVGALSGGERNRVQLARLLRRGGNLLILDEPTNDLDLVTLSVLEDALGRFPGCALIVSHDRWFLDKVATGILAFSGNGEVTFYEGDYSSWLERRATMVEPLQSPVEKTAITPPAMVKPIAAAPKKLSFKEKQELATIEAAITAAEARVSELTATLNDPAVYKSRAAEVPALVAALDAARIEVERLYARWQQLESLV